MNSPAQQILQQVYGYDAFRGQQFAGRVRRIAPYVLDLAKHARTVEVEAEFVNADEAKQLLIGYSADIEVVLERKDSVLRIPASALLDDSNVYRISDDDTLEKGQINTGLRSWSFVEITGGLAAGDRIVNNPARKLLAIDTLVKDKADNPDSGS